MKVEMYVLGLPNFRDDSVVFESDELNSIKKEISKYLRKKGLSEEESEAPGGWHVYKLNPERLYIEKPANSDEPYIKESNNFEIYLAEFGYYHHRVIIHLKLGLFDFYISEGNKVELKKSIYDIIENPTCCTREEIQKRLKKPVRNIINECLEERIDKINSFGKDGRNERIENYIDKKVRNELKKLVDSIVSEYIRKNTDEFRFLERRIRIKGKIKSCIQEELKEWKYPRTESERLEEWEELKSDLTEIEELKSDLTEIEELKSGLEKLINNTINEQMTELKKSEELIDNIIDELLEKKTDEPEFAKRSEIKEKIESYFQIRLKELEELKSELKETNKLRESEKSEELIDNIIDELLEEKTDELEFAKRIKIKEKIKVCIQIELKKDIGELSRELKEFSEFRDELKRLFKLKNDLRKFINTFVYNYIKEQKNRFYLLETVRNNKKKFVDCIIDIYVKKKMDKLNSFEKIGIGEKIRLFILEKIRGISMRFIDYEIDFFKTVEQVILSVVDIPGTIRRLANTINMCLEIKLRELLSKKIEKREDKFLALRDARKQLEKGTRNIINDCVIENVNKLIRSGKVTEKGEIEFIYTYPLIVVKSSAEKHEPVPFSEETTSLCFEIVEPKWWPLSGRKHMMRISIPSTILYVRKSIGRDVLRDIINAIYQYCLYEKKAKDENKKLIDWKNGPYNNQLDEDILTRLWEHVLHAMGGRSADLRVVRITNMTRLVALLSFMIAVASLFFAIIFRSP